MPIIMPRAFSTKLQKIVSAKEYVNDISDSLLCEDPKCRTEVTHVNEYERQYADKKITVEAFFRLKSKNFKHIEECKYNINNQVKVIARNSNSAIIESIKDGHYKFRISLVYSELSMHGSKNISTSDFENPTRINEITVKYVHDGELNPYISTMKKVIELRTKLDGNDELKNIIRLEIKDHLSKKTKEINWDDFYFSVSNYEKLYYYIASNKFHHVTCIEGIIKEFHEPSDKFSDYYIRLSSPSIKRIGVNNIKVPSLQLLIDNDKIYKYIKDNNTSNSRIAVFGIFSTPGNRISEIKHIEYLNIKCYIEKLKQIIFF